MVEETATVCPLPIFLGAGLEFEVQWSDGDEIADLTGWTLQLFGLAPELTGQVTATWLDASQALILITVKGLVTLVAGRSYDFRLRLLPPDTSHPAEGFPVFRLLPR